MDVGNPQDCVRFIDEVIGTYGNVDYLINNAGSILTARCGA